MSNAVAATVGRWKSIDPHVEGAEEGPSLTLPRIFRERQDVWLPLLRNVDTVSSHPELWDFLAVLVEATDAQLVVEAGTYRGHATFAMAEAMRQRGKGGHIYTSDVQDHGVVDVLDAVGLTSVSFVQTRFEHMVNALDGEIDLAFIDASEIETPSLRIDYVNLLVPRMRSRGVIVVDDCADDAWPGAKILRDACSMYLPLGRGTTVFQKR